MGLTKAERHNRTMGEIFNNARRLRTVTVTLEFPADVSPLWLEGNWPSGLVGYVQGLLAPEARGFEVRAVETNR